MSPKERAFIAAADDLYSAFCQSNRANMSRFQQEALNEFADASNAWADHPGKLPARGQGSEQKEGKTND